MSVLWCNSCKKEEDEFEFYKGDSYARGFSGSCKESIRQKIYERRTKNPEEAKRRSRESSRDLRYAYKLKVIELYGGSCVCCGETTPEFLSLDHVYNDGKEHRVEMGTTSVFQYYYMNKIDYILEGLQLLCWNCHTAKTNYKYCPHAISREEWLTKSPEEQAALGFLIRPVQLALFSLT